VALVRRACPIGPDDRAWVDHALAWLGTHLGSHAIHGRMLLPSDDGIASLRTGSESEIRALVERLCWQMGVDQRRVTVGEFFQTAEDEVVQRLPAGVGESLSAGHFRGVDGSVFIALESFEGSTPTQCVAAIAHELSHLRRPSPDEQPSAGGGEELVDLISVCLGLGVFAANACFDSVKVAGYRSVGYRTTLVGFMTERMYGYALARYALLRGEPDPTWARHLDVNPRTYLKQALRFLADQSGGRNA